jgi:predicted metal-binding membrane protein
MSPLEAVLKKDRAIVFSGLVLVVLLAWVYTTYESWRMTGYGHLHHGAMWMPPMGPWSAVDLGLLFVMWAVMMVAMMAPSVAPTVLGFATVNRRRQTQQQPYVPTGIFLAGYLLVWTGFSGFATVLQWVLHQFALMTPTMEAASPILSGLLLLAAGIYQWTPFKDACLTQCQSPMAYLMTQWREGLKGAFVMGVRHGAFCVGCCWLLMLLMFAGGVMSILWLALLTVFVMAEKLASPQWQFSRISGLVMAGWGTGILVT